MPSGHMKKVVTDCFGKYYIYNIQCCRKNTFCITNSTIYKRKKGLYISPINFFLIVLLNNLTEGNDLMSGDSLFHSFTPPTVTQDFETKTQNMKWVAMRKKI